MDREKKKMLALGILLGSVVLISVLFMIWNQFINYGTLILRGEAPFSVQVIDQKNVDCPTSPCEIRVKSGTQDIILTKEDREGIFMSTEVKLWSNTELMVKFRIQPYVVESEQIPELVESPDLEIVFDRNAQMQKLIRSDDASEKAIVYFQNSLDNPEIFANQNYVLIFEDELYKIDIKNNSRSKLPFIEDFEAGKWSLDGKSLVFSKKNSFYLWVMDEEENIKELTILSDIDQTSFTHDGQLIFLTQQTYSSSSGEITILDEISQVSITFGTYDPATGKYHLIENFENIPTVPEKLISTAIGNEIYFKIGEQGFKIVTQEF